MILGGPCTCWKRLRLESQCDRQEIDVFSKSEIQDGFRRRFGLHLESRWVQISSRALISSEKVDPGTGIEFHMILGDFQGDPRLRRHAQGKVKCSSVGAYNKQQAGLQAINYNLTILQLQSYKRLKCLHDYNLTRLK